MYRGLPAPLTGKKKLFFFSTVLSFPLLPLPPAQYRITRVVNIKTDKNRIEIISLFNFFSW